MTTTLNPQRTGGAYAVSAAIGTSLALVQLVPRAAGWLLALVPATSSPSTLGDVVAGPLMATTLLASDPEIFAVGVVVGAVLGLWRLRDAPLAWLAARWPRVTLWSLIMLAAELIAGLVLYGIVWLTMVAAAAVALRRVRRMVFSVVGLRR